MEKQIIDFFLLIHQVQVLKQVIITILPLRISIIYYVFNSKDKFTLNYLKKKKNSLLMY